MAVNMQQQKRTAAISLAVLLLGCSCLATVQARVQQMGEIRILAVGDSITQGSVPSKGANHPYTIKLKEILQSKYPGMNVVIDNDGMCSIDKATGALLHNQPAQAALFCVLSHQDCSQQQGLRQLQQCIEAAAEPVFEPAV